MRQLIRLERLDDPIERQLAKPLVFFFMLLAGAAPIVALFMSLALESRNATALLLAGPLVTTAGGIIGLIALRRGALNLATSYVSWSIVAAGTIHVTHLGHPDNQPFLLLYVIAITVSTMVGQTGTAIAQTIVAVSIASASLAMKLDNARLSFMPSYDGDPTTLSWVAFGLGLPMVTAMLVVFTGLLRGALRRSMLNEALAREAELRLETEVKRSQRALDNVAERNEELDAITEAAGLLVACNNAEEARAIIGDVLERLFRHGICRLYLIENMEARVAATTFPMAVDALPFAADTCWAVRRGVTHETRQGESSVVCDHIREKDRIDESLCLPLSAFGQLQGLLVWTASDLSDRDRDRERRRLRVVAEQLALALANLSMRASLASLQTEPAARPISIVSKLRPG